MKRITSKQYIPVRIIKIYFLCSLLFEASATVGDVLFTASLNLIYCPLSKKMVWSWIPSDWVKLTWKQRFLKGRCRKVFYGNVWQAMKLYGDYHSRNWEENHPSSCCKSSLEVCREYVIIILFQRICWFFFRELELLNVVPVLVWSQNVSTQSQPVSHCLRLGN